MSATKTRPKLAKWARKEAEHKLIAGLRMHMTETDTVKFGRRRYTRDEMIAVLKERIDVGEPIPAARAAWLALVAEERDVLAKTHGFVADLCKYLAVAYPDELVDFGLSPKKRRKLTSEEKKAAVDKARATRAARRR